MERPTVERLNLIRSVVEDGCQQFVFGEPAELIAEIEALTAERDQVRLDLALSRTCERQALRRGFDAALALDESFQVKFPEFEDFEKHVAAEAEHTVTLARIAEAEEAEKWPQDT